MFQNTLFQNTLQLDSDLEEIPRLLAWFEQYVNEQGIGTQVPSRVWLEAQTACLEGFTNAVRHAHAHLPTTTPIKVRVQIAAQCLQIQVLDQGAAFDLEAAWQQLSQATDQPDFDPLEREAHWGMLMLLKLRNEHGWSIGYQCDPDTGNCLAMVCSFSD